MWEVLIGSALGGLFSSLSEQSRVEQAQANIERAKAAIQKSLVSDSELRRLLVGNQRFYSSRLTNLMNTTAISGRGFANLGTIKAAAAAPMLAESAGRDSQIQQSVFQHNKGIYNSLANLDASMPISDSWGSTFAGMLEGGLAGYELTKGGKSTTQPITERTSNSTNILGNEIQPNYFPAFNPRTSSIPTWEVPMSTRAVPGWDPFENISFLF